MPALASNPACPDDDRVPLNSPPEFDVEFIHIIGLRLGAATHSVTVGHAMIVLQ